jgi:hypothetical protein
MNYQQILAETYQESAGAQEHHSEKWLEQHMGGMKC